MEVRLTRLVAATVMLIPSLAAPNPLSVDVRPDGFTVSVAGWPEFTLDGGSTGVMSQGRWYTSADRSLAPTLGPHMSTGSDAWGDFDATTITWGNPNTPQMRTTFRVYTDVSAIVFETSFPRGITTGAEPGNRENVSSSFPSFTLPAASTAGFSQWSGPFLNNGNGGPRFGLWNADGVRAALSAGLQGGPITIFDEVGAHTLVLSAASSFMATSCALFSDELVFGALGSASMLPAGWSQSVVLWYGTAGINPTVMAWGSALMASRGKTRVVQQSDETASTLVYNTDHGAYYYYHPEDGKDFFGTLLDVHAYAEEAGIPYRSLLIDSWFYFKGVGNGVKNWTARPDIFPGGNAGLRNLINSTGWHVVAHNRYWSKDNDYARANGGNYEFYLDGLNGDMAVPLEQSFWEYLLPSARAEWGLTTYEQDWLYNMLEGVDLLTTNVTAARTWLLQLDAGAARAGVTTQLCMAYPRFALQSIEMSRVTQIRVSDDHVPNGDASMQWRIGYSSLLAWSLGLAPFKDGWFSTHVQPGGSVGDKSEISPALQGAIATLSAGPVAPGDGVGFSDASLILRSCTAGGRLLQPSRAATAIDAGFRAKVWGVASGGPSGEVYATRSIVSGLLFHHIISAALEAPYDLTLDELVPMDAEVSPTPSPRAGRIAYSIDAVSFDHATLVVRPFAEGNPIPLHTTSEPDFEVWHTAPVFDSGWAVLGELDKWVPTAVGRITTIAEQDGSVSVSLTGEAGEGVVIYFWSAATNSTSVVCVLSADGTAVASVPSATCA